MMMYVGTTCTLAPIRFIIWHRVLSRKQWINYVSFSFSSFYTVDEREIYLPPLRSSHFF